METLAKFCPNIESFRLFLRSTIDGKYVVEGISFRETLLAIRFKKLISLRLYGSLLQLQDGAFLLKVINLICFKLRKIQFYLTSLDKQIIKESPGLRILHLDGSFEPDSFLRNFRRFLLLATNLRDLR